MPAACSVLVAPNEACRILAVARCGRCRRPFCRQHAGTYSELCRDCQIKDEEQRLKANEAQLAAARPRLSLQNELAAARVRLDPRATPVVFEARMVGGRRRKVKNRKVRGWSLGYLTFRRPGPEVNPYSDIAPSMVDVFAEGILTNEFRVIGRCQDGSIVGDMSENTAQLAAGRIMAL